MGLWDWFRGNRGKGVDELAQRLGMTANDLKRIPISYKEFKIPKRRGGVRAIAAPSVELKKIQRVILRRVLGRLSAHPAAMGFERGRSIVSHAQRHAGKRVVVSMDIKDFFTSTSANRVQKYFRIIGWNREAADLLTQFCTYNGALPQGAPTSPKLSNLVNCRLDARLAALAERHGACYSRYADDLTFSFENDSRQEIHVLIRAVKLILQDEGYSLHLRKKLRIRRRYQRQLVTGLVVNDRPQLPRTVRRYLRAVEHALSQGKPATLSPQQWEGWRAFRAMVETPQR